MTNPEKLHRFMAPGACRLGDLIALAREQSRHLAAVLRIGTGRRVRIFTGAGDEFIGQVEKADTTVALVRICEKYESSEEARTRLTLGFAPPPGQRADMLIEKATELGVSCLKPLICERLQGFQATAAGRRVARWQRKAQEAARQSQRALVPEVHPPLPFKHFVRDAREDLRLIGSTGQARGLWQLLAETSDAPSSVNMAVGPAGGFTQRELQLAAEADFIPVSIGPHVLRVETAAICMAGTVLIWLDGRPPA